MRFALRSMALASGMLALMASPSRSQMMAPPVVSTQPYATAAPRAYTNYNASVLPGFGPRGGVGTTPFLGNTRGLGAYSYNYDRPVARPYTTTNQANGRRWFRRYR